MLALFAAAAVASEHPPGFKPADWYRQPTPAELRAVMPAAAAREGLGGSANLRCLVNVHGGLDTCQVLSESPPGRGFGAAALAMTPQFLFRPATVKGAPEPSWVTFPVNWHGFNGEHSPLTGPVETVILRPVWAAAPGFADLAAVYPPRGGGVAGYVAFHCRATADGTLQNCDLDREEPMNRGFERAAKRLIDKFRVDPRTLPAGLSQPLALSLKLRLTDPTSDDITRRRVGAVDWTAGLDVARAQKLFPIEAAAKGLTSGLGVAHCVVAADGALTGCTPRPAEPEGMGFSEAAVLVAGVMKMNPWTADGGPVDGAEVNLPIRFNLATGAAASAAKP